MPEIIGFPTVMRSSLEIRINLRESEWSWISRNQRYPEAVTDGDPFEISHVSTTWSVVTNWAE